MSRLRLSLPWPLLPILMVLIVPVRALELPDEDTWVETSTHYGVTLSMAHDTHHRLKTVRAETQFALADHRALGLLLSDVARMADWWHMISHAMAIDVNDNEDWLYLTTRLPLFIPNRDTVVRLEHHDSPTAFTVSISSRPDRYPTNEEMVRIPELAGELRVRILDEKDVVLSYQLILDPGGRVPPTVADSLLQEHALYTVKALRIALPQL